MRKLVITSFVFFSLTSFSFAEEEYSLVSETNVFGEFKGCTPQVGIKLDGKLFVCTTFGFSNALNYPKAEIYKSKTGKYKVKVNGTEYEGYFVEPEKTKSNVEEIKGKTLSSEGVEIITVPNK